MGEMTYEDLMKAIGAILVIIAFLLVDAHDIILYPYFLDQKFLIFTLLRCVCVCVCVYTHTHTHTFILYTL